MRRTRRSSSPEILVERLAKKHAKLDKRVRELSKQRYLSPTDEMTARALKKQKLAAKDALMSLD